MPGQEDKTEPRERIPEDYKFESSQSTLGQFTVFGVMLFLWLLTVLIMLQDTITSFAPEDHVLTRECGCKHKLRTGVCRPFVEKRCASSKRKPILSETLASFGYYAMAGLPYSTFLNAFVQPGVPYGTFVDSGDSAANVTTAAAAAEHLLSPNYMGGSVFRPSLSGFDFMMMMLFVCGCAWFILLPSFCMWIPRESTLGKPRKGWQRCIMMIFPVVYLACMLMLAIIVIATAVGKDIDLDWNLSAIVFAVNVDWSAFRFRVPSMLGIPALTSFALGFCRLVTLFGNYIVVAAKHVGRTAKVAGSAVAAAAKETAEATASVKIVPSGGEDATVGILSQSESSISVTEGAVEQAKAKVQGKAKKMAIAKADAVGNNIAGSAGAGASAKEGSA
jgi:hypothetical protein